MTTKLDSRVHDLLAWMAETGKKLPCSIKTILAYEDAGFVIDLETGELEEFVDWCCQPTSAGLAAVAEVGQ